MIYFKRKIYDTMLRWKAKRKEIDLGYECYHCKEIEAD